jgi:predicted transcriptional regulator YdeE
MITVQSEPFYILGISVRTSNNNGEAARDIGGLWQRFMSDDILEKIPNKIDSSIYSVYCNYESDYTAAYTTILGCKVSTIKTIPEGLEAIIINAGHYQQFKAKGNLMEGVVSGMDKNLE